MIIIGLGTRAEAIKMIPIIEEMKSRQEEYFIIATGQHNINTIIEPNAYLTPPPTLTSRFGMSKIKAGLWSIEVIYRMCLFLAHTDRLVVHGDTLSAALLTIAGKIRGCEIIHIEAGLRSGCDEEPIPEEMIRKIIDKYSNILFVPTNNDLKNLSHYKDKKKYVVGNTIIDNLVNYNLKTSIGTYIVASIHRQENLRSIYRMRMIITALNHINMPVYIYAHDPFIDALEKFNLILNKNVRIVKMISHEKFMQKIAGCYFVIADGGSIQEECAYLNKPCILFREYTERHGFDFGKGNTSKLIVDKLVK